MSDEIDILTGEIKRAVSFVAIAPASHYVVPMERILKATKDIETSVIYLSRH